MKNDALISTSVVIRRATNCDAAQVQHLIAEVLAEYGLKFDLHGADHVLQDLEATYTNAGGLFSVAELEGKIIASVGLRRKRDGVFELEKMYVRAAARGQGLGRRLFEEAMTFAKAHHAARIELDTSSKLREAVAMYEKYRFKPKPDIEVARCDKSYYLDL